MGYNTVVMFSNDQITDARNDPKKTMDAVYARALGDDTKPVPYGIKAMAPYHADVAPIFIGGANNLTWLGDVHWSKKSDIPAVLRAIAEKHGYKIAIRSRPKV